MTVNLSLHKNLLRHRNNDLIATGGMYDVLCIICEYLRNFCSQSDPIEVIILLPEMRRNSPTAISDFKTFSGEKPQTPLKGGRGDWGEESERGGELAYPNVKLCLSVTGRYSRPNN